MTSELHKALARLAGNRHSDGTSSLISMEDRTILIDCFHDLMLNPRAMPDVPELVRYVCEHDYDSGTSLWANGGDLKGEEGEYVRYDQAAAVIANLKEINANLMGDDEDKPRYTTKRLKIEIEKAVAAKDAEISNFHGLLAASNNVIDGLQAKLAQSEKQDPVGYVRIYDSGCLSNISETPIKGYVPLYTAPVASDADLRALALEIAQYTDPDYIPRDVFHRFRAALNPSEPRT